MDSRQPLDNQRESFRCRVPQGQQAAELHLGRDRHAVQILDESAGGFAIAVEGPALEDLRKLEMGAQAVLQTAAGTFEVQITNFSAIAPNRGWRANASPKVRIGLKRLCELPSAGACFHGLPLLARLRATIVPRQTPVMGSFLMVGLLFMAIAVAGTLWLTQDGRKSNPAQTIYNAVFRSPRTMWDDFRSHQRRVFPVLPQPAATRSSVPEESSQGIQHPESRQPQQGEAMGVLREEQPADSRILTRNVSDQ